MVIYYIKLICYIVTCFIYRILYFFIQDRSSKGKRIPLDSSTIPKYKNQLIKPPVYKPLTINVKINSGSKKCICKKRREKRHLYQIDISEFRQQILPKGYPKTVVWGYGGLVKDAKTGKVCYTKSSPGATFEATRNVPVTVKWVNKLRKKHVFPVDPTLHWANPNHMPMEPSKPWPAFPPGFKKAQKPVPVVTHLHGGEVPSIYDGHPDAWFTFHCKKGPAFITATFIYPNKQLPATLWYHDHALGITRLNVYSGLAGFYLLRDSNVCREKHYHLPEGNYEIPIAIQDRSFYTDGSFAFTSEGINPDIHPYWNPEFFGDAIMVNGKVWPYLDVDRTQYRFRVLNGSNARFYNLFLSNGMAFQQIGSDGGYLAKPVTLTELLLAPGERADILFDFSQVESGIEILLLNNANAPYPDGQPTNPDTDGQIMKFKVKDTQPVKPLKLPSCLNYIPALIPDAPERILTLNEVMGPNGPVAVLLNGQKWEDPITENPKVGSTEDWVIANLTMDTHPIHLHLVQFQLVNRQDFNAEDYKTKWEEMNGMAPLDHPTEAIPIEPYLIGNPISPDTNETGWKDTVRMNPNQVTRIRIRFAPQDVPVPASKPGRNLYPFDPTIGPGYVWHCHILDHEDNEMMRPYKVRAK